MSVSQSSPACAELLCGTRNHTLLVAEHLQLADQQSCVGCSFNPLPSLPSDFQCWHNLEVLKLNCCELQVSFYK